MSGLGCWRGGGQTGPGSFAPEGMGSKGGQRDRAPEGLGPHVGGQGGPVRPPPPGGTLLCGPEP